MRKAACWLVAIVVAAATVATSQAHTADKVVKIGVLTDMSSIFADNTGQGSVLAAQLAAEDRAKDMPGFKIEVISADHQNKADIGANIAREWIDVEHVDAIVDVPNSAVALAVNGIVRNGNKVMLVSGGGLSDLTGKQCSPNTVHWTYDTWMAANGLGRSLIKAGGDTFFFLTADYAFGHALERDLTEAVQKLGGSVSGHVLHPINTLDFSSYLLQAQASKAKVVVLANGGADTVNSIKQAHEFGLTNGGQKIAALIIGMPDIRALGPEIAQGLLYITPWYWNRDDDTRVFAERFAKRHPQHSYPTFMHAGVYSAVYNYLKAVTATGAADDGAKVVAKMKETPTDDPAFGRGTIRQDGRKVHPVYLVQVKSPSESESSWDYEKVVATIGADEAFRPLHDGGCPLVKP
jgi:branched-chain amino acid transport system substrate-binding protein